MSRKAEVIARLKKNRGVEIESQIAILKDLNEVKSEGWELSMSYHSLYEFAMMELNYNRNEAFLRIRAAELMALDPSVEGALRTFQICQTSLMLAHVAFSQESQRRKVSKEEKIEVISKLKGSVNNAKRILADHFPDIRKDIEETKPLKNGRTQIKYSVSNETNAKFIKLKNIFAHQNFSGKWEPFFDHLADIALEQYDPEVKQARKEARKKSALEVQIPLSRCSISNVSQEDARKAKINSGYRCQWVDPATGRRCTSEHGLQVDHIIPKALGGTNEISNLRILCGAHNRYAAKQMGLRRKPTSVRFYH